MGEKYRTQSGTSRDTVALFLSVICVLGVLHLEWKRTNCELNMLVQEKDDCKLNVEYPESDLSDDTAQRIRTKRSLYPIETLRQVVRIEIHEILDHEFCTEKEQVCIKGSQGEKAKPAFSVKPKAAMTEVGKTVTLVCKVRGQPTPRVWWTKVPIKDIKVHPRILSYTRDGQLTISNASKHDQGIYICHAENTLGRIFTSAKLTVLSPLKFTIFPPKAVMTVLGEKLELHCVAEAGFRPLVTWTMKDHSFMPSGSMIYPNGTLIISKVSRSHQGKYECIATSEISFIHTTVNVTVKFPESCSIIRKFVTRISGSYVIDSDGDGGEEPFVVYCNMTEHDEIGVTVVSHDSEDRIVVDGCDSKGCYSRQVQYTGASLKQLTSLTKVSAKCEQFIRYECYNTWFLGEGYAWWMSRDGEKMTHWGGAPVESDKCACGVTNSCVGGWKCNCDYLERRWKEDSGFLGDKSILPVSELRFGDTEGSAEQGFHTLGKLKCYGIA